MKYPPYSWLRLSGEIRQSPSRMWFSFNKLPAKLESATVRVHIGSNSGSFMSDPFDALSMPTLMLHREQKVLELFLKIAKPTKNKGEFLVDHASFGSLLPFASAIPFEISSHGVLSFSRHQARIRAQLKDAHSPDSAIVFSLVKTGGSKLKNPLFFGDINAYVIDEDLKLYPITPNVTEAEAISIINSAPLPLLGLCQKESRQMFYALSRLGIDFSCLDEVAVEPDQSRIILRVLLAIDDQTKRMCARAHLVTELTLGDFFDEVEIKSTWAIPTIHISAKEDLDEERFVDVDEAPQLIRRPAAQELEARHFLYHLGASPARLHDGFELAGEDAFKLLKSIAQKDLLPGFLTLDENVRPQIIELSASPTLRISADTSEPKRVEVAMSLSAEFDETGASFTELLENTKDDVCVLNEDSLVVSTESQRTLIKYLSETLGLASPSEQKSKSVAQMALLLNSLTSQISVVASDELKNFFEHFNINVIDEDRQLPVDLKTTLRPYQHDAVAWLSALHRSGLGGLLGDEMGLGKTLMVLTHLARLKEAGFSKKPALVVSPTSVMDVWRNEAYRHFNNLSVAKWHGPERNLQDDEVSKADIIITSYAIMRRDLTTKLKDLQFSTLVIDEAQYVRNQQTDSFKSAKAITCEHRLALTGTPIENHLSDLYNILDCVEEGILGAKSKFERQFVSPIEAGEQDATDSLKRLLAPILMRRRKSEVESELPPKIESVVHCKLSPLQRKLYKHFVQEMTGQLLNTNDVLISSTTKVHFSLLAALTRLRQICCHPSLLLADDEAPFDSSGKLLSLKDILSECLEMGRKIIVYSQFLKMQEHIVNLAKSLHEQGALWLHGSTTNRDEIIKEFQKESGPRIIVVSLKAGGTGITLTEADTVIFADPWWNPAVEDQAVDRAHRIGQKKTVHVIRIIAEESVEQEVLALAQKKRLSAQSILHEGFKNSASLTKDEVRSLLLREVDRVWPHDDDRKLASNINDI